MAFQKLYLGGSVDFVESHEKKVDCKLWAHHQLYLADGRFAKDKMCCFHDMNYVERRRNQTQGRWFVENFPSLDDLKKNIEDGEKIFKKCNFCLPQFLGRMLTGEENDPNC
jgi:hypothetical protein